MTSVRTLVRKMKEVIRKHPELLEETERGWTVREADEYPHGTSYAGRGGGEDMEAFPARQTEGRRPPRGPPAEFRVEEDTEETTESPIDKKGERGRVELNPEDVLDLPDIDMVPAGVSSEEEEAGDIRTINVTYPLIPSRPRKGDRIYAYANIRWDPNSQGLVYEVMEPTLSPGDRELLKRVKETLQERLDVSLEQITSSEAEDYLEGKIDEVLDVLEMGISAEKRETMTYYIKRDFIGLDRIEPLMHDPYIEDISCDGTGIPIYVYHRNPRIASVPTNISFDDKDQLDSFVMKLAQKAGRSISMAEPMVDAALPDGSRLQATLSTDIARRGSNFTIRKFTERPLTPTDIINFGTLDSRMMAYLWMCAEHGKSMLMAGGTATGKTTLLNVVSMFIRPEMKIVSIEDTPELRLTHPHWIPEVAREAISSQGEGEYGAVDLYDLLKSSMRQRPDYIIVGEVRGREAYVLFQQMATGHTGLSTLHAETLEKLVDRLTTEPINLSPALIEMLDVVVFLKRERQDQGYVRRTNRVYEIVGFDRDNMFPLANEVFRWDPHDDNFESTHGSRILQQISEFGDMTAEETRQEVIDRAKVLEWMRKRKITDYRDISKIVRLYYANPDAVMERVEAEL